MSILLIDVGGKIANYALMKISTYFKSLGANVYLNKMPDGIRPDKVFISVIFPWDKPKVLEYLAIYPEAKVGGPGWDLKKTLPPDIEACKPDFDLYSVDALYPRIKGISDEGLRMRKAEERVQTGIGFTSRGCIRKCKFCIVPEKEGDLRQVGEIGDLLSPHSNNLMLLDNNFTADPYCIDKLAEIKERGLVLEISQGIDVRLMTDELAYALSTVKHRANIHYAWDLMESEGQVMDGIKVLSQQIKPYRHTCYMLVGFNTTFEQDLYRLRRLTELGIRPYIMVYNDGRGIDRKKFEVDRLKHFERWVNGRICSKCTWEEYEPWIKAQEKHYVTQGQLSLGIG